MKYFITGGAGFIGSFLVDKLLAWENSVTVYDNLSSGHLEFIKAHSGNKRFKFIRADLFDMKKLRKCIKDADFVFHLAANPDIRYGIRHTMTDINQNTLATYNVLEAMRFADVRRIAFSIINQWTQRGPDYS